jgi:hypothetical protein
MQAIVCGGAKSLVSDIKKVPKDCIKISANHHAANMLACDYIVSVEQKRIMAPLLKWMDGEIVSTKGLKVVGYSGTAAVDFALKRLKCDTVYIAGMDLYTTDYYHSESKPVGVKRPYSERVSFWEHYRDSLGELKKCVIPISGPLIQIWT